MIQGAGNFDLLVIEDNPADMFLLVKMLNSSGLGIQNIYTADHLAEAHKLLSSHPGIRTVLLDLSLPDSFGLESYFNIREVARHIPVIILTGLADTSVALEALKAGAQDYLVKGQFTPELLIRSIQYSIERKQLEKELDNQRKQEQIQITTAVLAAQEQERTMLGEELHDNINQIIVSAKLYLDMGLKKSENPLKDILRKSSRYMSMAIEEIRKLSKTLIKPTLGADTLVLSLADLMEMMKQASPVNVKMVHKNLNAEKLSEEHQLAIYRIVQEQLNNIVKHAQAKNVIINIDNTTTDQIILSIEDDGKGFDKSHRRKGVGITNITSRAEVLDGKVEIDTAPGQGCRLKVVFENKG